MAIPSHIGTRGSPSAIDVRVTPLKTKTYCIRAVQDDADVCLRIAFVHAHGKPASMRSSRGMRTRQRTQPHHGPQRGRKEEGLLSRKNRRTSTAKAMIEAAVQIALLQIAADTRSTQTDNEQPTTVSSQSVVTQ